MRTSQSNVTLVQGRARRTSQLPASRRSGASLTRPLTGPVIGLWPLPMQRPDHEGRDRACRGFTLIEAMIAGMILLTAIAALSAGIEGSLVSVSYSRQSQQASDIAQAVLAQVEALPWDTGELAGSTGTGGVTSLVVSPLQEAIGANDKIVLVDAAHSYYPVLTVSSAAVLGSTTISVSTASLTYSVPTGSAVLDIGSVDYGLLGAPDPTFSADPNVTTGTGGWCFEGNPLVVGGRAASSCTSSTWTNLPVGPTCTATSLAPSAVPVPLEPHQQCVNLDGTTFELALYPTQVGSASIYQQLRVTVAVSWGATSTSYGASRVITASATLANCAASVVRCS